MTSTAETEGRLTAACATIRVVIARWPDFVEAKTKGTPRPHVHSMPRHRSELEEGSGYGSSPAPMHLDILDSMATIVAWSDMLHEHVAQTVGHDRLPPAASAFADPRPFLAYVVELLPEAAETDPEITDAVHEKARRMESIILVGLGEIFDGQTLDAICPFCIGQTFKRPGERTLRVRDVPSRITEGEMEFVVVCENPDGCRPFSVECDMWVKGHPAWPWSQWDWLAERLIPAKVA